MSTSCGRDTATGFHVVCTVRDQSVVIVIGSPRGIIPMRHHVNVQHGIEASYGSEGDGEMKIVLRHVPVVIYSVVSRTKPNRVVVDIERCPHPQQGVRVLIQIPKRSTWHLCESAPAIVPQSWVDRAAEGVIQTEAARAGRERRRREAKAAATQASAPSDFRLTPLDGAEPPASRSRKKVQRKKSAKPTKKVQHQHPKRK